MTTISLFTVAGPFTDVAGNRLEPATETFLLDKLQKIQSFYPLEI